MPSLSDPNIVSTCFLLTRRNHHFALNSRKYVVRHSSLSSINAFYHTHQDNQKLIDADCMRVAWGLSHHAPFEPVVIFSRGSVAYVYSIVRGGMAGYIRGHGGVCTLISSRKSATSS